VLRQLDRIVMTRVAARIGVTIAVLFGLAILVESLDSSKFAIMQAAGGLPLAILAMVTAAARFCIGTLPVIVLIGTIAAVIDLQSRNELAILKASGASIWRIVRTPFIAVLIGGGLLSTVVDSWTITIDRTLPQTSRRTGGAMWLDQTDGTTRYIIHAKRTSSAAPQLRDLTVYGWGERERIFAANATYEDGKWVLNDGSIYSALATPRAYIRHEIGTTMTRADLYLLLSRARDRTVLELLGLRRSDVSDPALRAIAQTSLYRAFMLPLVAGGSVLLAFALAGSYRRQRDYGGAILIGVIVGFIIYVVNELSTRAGNAQIISPLAATLGPAALSLLVGATALLFREDGRR
jgi:lipopolysaccharide export system permease protein